MNRGGDTKVWLKKKVEMEMEMKSFPEIRYKGKKDLAKPREGRARRLI